MSSDPELDAIIADALEEIGDAIGGLPAELISGIVDLVQTVVSSSDVASALARAKQNALADAEDAAAVLAADEAIKLK